MTSLPVAIDLVRAPFWMVGWVSALLWLASFLLFLAGSPGGAGVFAAIAVVATTRAIRVRVRSQARAPQKLVGSGRPGVRTTEELRLARVPGHFILLTLFAFDAILLTAFFIGAVR